MVMEIHDKGRNAHKQAKSETAVVTDFGTRAVSEQSYSKIVALPKQALTNCGEDVRKVNVQLVQAGTQKFLKLTPVEEAE